MKTKSATLMERATWGALLLAAAAVVSVEAQAGRPFGSAAVASLKVFCDMPEIKGNFSAQDSRYVSRGTCVQMTGVTPGDHPNVERSEFPLHGAANSREIFRADWSAEGRYDPTTKEAWEQITLPAPTIDQPAPAGRPYGRFESKMICVTDPWLEPIAKCTGIGSSATGNLGDLGKPLRAYARPFTSTMKQGQWQTLYDAHQAFVKRRAAMFSDSTTSSKTPRRSYTLPEMIEPRAGSTHPPQTPLKIRVAAPKNLKVQSYLLEIESKQGNGSWKLQANLPVTALEVEGPLGYRGWGWHKPGTGPLMTASAGSYRIRARSVNPDQGESGEWREFTIAGQPGRQPDELRKGAVVTSSGLDRAAAPQAAPAGLGSATKATLDWNRAAPGGTPSPLPSRKVP